MLDLQLSYSNLGALQFNFLEKTVVEQGNPEMISHRNALLRDVTCRQAPDRAPTPLAGPRSRGTTAIAGPTAPAPTSAPNTPSPRAARPQDERTDPRCPTVSPPYSTACRRLSAPIPRPCRQRGEREPPFLVTHLFKSRSSPAARDAALPRAAAVCQ
jgi:hypothetical protein